MNTVDYDRMLGSELEATRMMIERQGSKALVVAVIAEPSTEPGLIAEVALARSVSSGTTRKEAEAFVHALRREADRIEGLLGKLTTYAEPKP